LSVCGRERQQRTNNQRKNQSQCANHTHANSPLQIVPAVFLRN
jgi:hypothetical protein